MPKNESRRRNLQPAQEPETEGRRAADGQIRCIEPTQGCGKTALGNSRTEFHDGIATIGAGDDFLANEHFRQLGDLFAAERDGSGHLFRGGIVRFLCNPGDP